MQVTAAPESVGGSLVFPVLFELTELSSFDVFYLISCIEKHCIAAEAVSNLKIAA